MKKFYDPDWLYGDVGVGKTARMGDMDWDVEQLYNQAKTIVKVIEENQSLKEELEYYKKKEEESRNRLDQQYKDTMNQVGGILNKMIEKSEQE